MSNGNSKLPPNSGMSDERWLGRNERQEQSGRTDISSAMRAILNHAEAADELIADARKAAAYALESFRWILKEEPRTGGAVKAAMSVGKLERLLARVDALTKDTA